MHTVFRSGNLKGRDQLGRPRHRWNDNVRTDLGEIVGWCRLDASGSGQVPVVGCCEHGNEHLGFIKGREFLD
jgi:hypothetical protein